MGGIFGNEVPASSQIVTKHIKLDEILDYHNHTFSVNEEGLAGLVESFLQNPKAIAPITVRLSAAHGNPYECIAGHRRRMAARLAGMDSIPACVVEMDDDEADIWMVDSNLSTRKQITLREECFSLKVKYEALRRQGKAGGRTDELLAGEKGVSRMTVQRLIRLTCLTDGLFGLVEEGRLTKQAGETLAGMSKKDQNLLFGTMCAFDKMPKIRPRQAEAIAALAKEGGMTEEGICAVLGEAGTHSPQSAAIKEIRAWFPEGYAGTPDDMLALAQRLVREYFAGNGGMV
jgi:ParB family chromosome partitioning protein